MRRRQTSHLDTDVLAEFRAGLITGRRRRAIAAHLAGCARCTAADGQLAELSALLAAIPAPVMPDSVAQRLDAALAAEVARNNDPERAVAHHSRRRRAPRPARRPTLQLVLTRVLVPAAAVAVLAAGGYGLSLIGGQSSSSSSATAGSAAVPAAASAVPSAAQANGLPAPSASAPAANPGIQKSALALVPEGIDFLPATLRAQLEAALRAPAATRSAPPSSRQLGACVRRLTSGVSPGTLKLLESAYYQGRPAIVIVASSGSGYLAWVVAPGWVTPGCSATSAGVLARTALPGISAP